MSTFKVESPEADFLLAAYMRKKPEIDAQVVDDSENVYIDPLQVSTSIDGIFPKLSALREPLIQKINGFDVAKFDSLPDYGHALHYCHSQHLAAINPAVMLSPEVITQATSLRDRLFSDASALALREIIPADAVADVKKVLGHRGIMLDLTLLQNAFKKYGTTINGRCGATEAELQEANQLIARLSVGVGLRERSPQEIAAAKLERRKAFFLLRDVYEEIRVYVKAVRHHQRDYDLYAPYVYGNPNSGRKPLGTKTNEEEPPTHESGLHPVVPAPSAAPTPELTTPVLDPGAFKRA